MGSPLTRRAQPAQQGLPLEQWKLEDAKARFSEVVRRATEAGPQLVTVRGREAAVILSAEQYRRLTPSPKKRIPLSRFLQNLRLDRLDLERVDAGRDADRGREVEL